jgi:hypothetical protein
LHDLLPLQEFDHRGARQFLLPPAPQRLAHALPGDGWLTSTHCPGRSRMPRRYMRFSRHLQGLASFISIDVTSPLRTKSP